VLFAVIRSAFRSGGVHDPDVFALRAVGDPPEEVPLRDGRIRAVPNGTCRHRVTRSGTGLDFDPSWSPDGRRIAYSSGAFRGREIWIMNADGSGKHRVTHWPGADGPVAIVFSHFRGDEPLPRYYWMKPNGTGIRSFPLLKGAGDPIDWLPRAAPDSRCR
jgi:WD40-like Beta Propeller Repeat